MPVLRKYPDEQYSPRLAGRRSFRFYLASPRSQRFYVIVVTDA